MKIIKTADEFVQWRKTIQTSLGFIPTMGALHDGHLSLIHKSKKLCDQTVVSIFINPMQFAPNEDLDAYPKTINKDVANLKKLKVDVLFLPTEKEMYEQVDSVEVKSSDLFLKLEGKSRPHFFYGVTTIVAKLFNVIQPSHTFFGEKDAQQLRIIKQMINHMNYNIMLISCPTIRNQNGLALSSRNQYLSDTEKLDAAHFYSCLMNMKYHLDQGERSPQILKKQFEINMKQYPKFKIDYISIACSDTLDEIENIVTGKVLISGAVFYNNVRLIDNFIYQSST